ncbi:MAG: hypothetical protein PHH84_04105 [Oscillospiraceae bacterium]|nr:hypothetical protein [Oscillospiraceae bacterium]
MNASEVIPIWDVVSNLEGVEGTAVKSKAIEDYFDSKVDKISNDFESIKTYISDVYVGYDRTETSAKNTLRSNGVSEGHIVNIDLNKSVGGEWIYLGYKTTTDKSKAITGIIADYYSSKKSSDLTNNGIKYKIIPVDLNKGASGKYIYLYYTKDQKAGNPISEIHTKSILKHSRIERCVPNTNLN